LRIVRLVALAQVVISDYKRSLEMWKGRANILEVSVSSDVSNRARD